MEITKVLKSLLINDDLRVISFYNHCINIAVASANISKKNVTVATKWEGLIETEELKKFDCKEIEDLLTRSTNANFYLKKEVVRVDISSDELSVFSQLNIS